LDNQAKNLNNQMNLEKYGQYKNDLFNKVRFNFKPGLKILDVGCGDGSDAKIFIDEYMLDFYGIDIYKHENLDKIKDMKFKESGIYDIPFEDNTFDYVFLHDVLHHIDEENQSYEKHIAGIKELKRVCKNGGYVVVVEANRYNPLFYFHMVKQMGHDHFKQNYFKKIFRDVFGSNAKFKYLECHFYPQNFLWFWKIFEFIMEHFIPKKFLSYNVAIVKNIKQ
jgi:ubiquinone/menaquinone biosynthesis C-methylase UbiE